MWRSSFSIAAMERRFPHAEGPELGQWLRAGRMASIWESMISHWFKSNTWRVSATCSSRTCRSSGLKSATVIPLRSKPFSWLMLGHWDRWVKSDSVRRQWVIARLSKGSSDTCEEKEQLGLRNRGGRWSPGERQVICPRPRSFWPSNKGQYPTCPVSF